VQAQPETAHWRFVKEWIRFFIFYSLFESMNITILSKFEFWQQPDKMIFFSHFHANTENTFFIFDETKETFFFKHLLYCFDSDFLPIGHHFEIAVKYSVDLNMVCIFG
jgi:glycosidase